MTFELIFIGFAALIFGGVLGGVFWWWKNRETRDMTKILNNPERLLEKLKAHGQIYDQGRPITIGIKTTEDGKKQLTIERGPEVVPKKAPTKKESKDKKGQKKDTEVQNEGSK